ncbi:hypothetical protein GCM10010218_39500 [Streptomyces mashuensis]|uniref:DUF4166 domain-containing protein n=1 Tax=Streptomyces mashuensis TaxID=33904 RepID=A0A919EEI1_9ACTN|nr:DUF4166 domain-containing protein [Streptomyces mashuensis]GHF54346.1 hypothetical protein GCM10010218_39500 [Streptomyces mashuensis]
MTSIFQRALGMDFGRLHPQIRRRFSVGLDSGEACVGRGTMERVWHGRGFVKPFLTLGGSRNILVPRAGRDVPFTIENVPYLDSYGRETVTFVRTFAFPDGDRRFDATMIYSPARRCVVDYLGTHQHLASDLHFAAGPGGSLVIRSGEHRFREGLVDARVPGLVAGDATVRESYDDATERFRIEVSVVNRRFGPLFGYTGCFTADFVDAGGLGIRDGLRPVREEARV